MYIKINEIVQSILTDSITEKAAEVKVVGYIIDLLRQYTDTGFDGSSKTVVLEIGHDLMYKLPNDFAGVVRIGKCEDGCFYSLSIDNSLVGDYCSCDSPEEGDIQNYCGACGGFYDWGNGVYFSGVGWWQNGLWYSGAAKMFAGISSKSMVGTYKVERLSMSEDFIRFSSNLVGKKIVMEYRTSYKITETAIPIEYKLPCIEYCRWQYFKSKGDARAAQYYEMEYLKQSEIARLEKDRKSYGLDEFIRMRANLFGSVKIM